MNQPEWHTYLRREKCSRQDTCMIAYVRFMDNKNNSVIYPEKPDARLLGILMAISMLTTRQGGIAILIIFLLAIQMPGCTVAHTKKEKIHRKEKSKNVIKSMRTFSFFQQKCLVVESSVFPFHVFLVKT